jgi:hypothetical protein
MLSLSISTRDNEYYISDGNTVLLVENILFKVRVRNPSPPPKRRASDLAPLTRSIDLR